MVKDTNAYTEPPEKGGICNRTKEEVLLQEQGWRKLGYKHPWGEAPSYSRAVEGEKPLTAMTTATAVVFVHDGTVKDRAEMCKWLETNWTPTTESEWIFFVDKMHLWFMLPRPVDWDIRARKRAHAV
jgi:hypothetical protein